MDVCKTESKILQDAQTRALQTKAFQSANSVSGWDYNDGGSYSDGYGDAGYGDASYGEGPNG